MYSKKILVSRFSSIGDIVLCTPVVRVLKKQLSAEVHFVTKSKFRGLLESNPYIDKVWSFEGDIPEIDNELRKENFDLLVDLHKNLRSYRLGLKLSIPAIRFDKLNFDKFVHIKLGISRLTGHHIIDRYFQAIEQLGVIDDGLGMDGFYAADGKKLMSKFGLKSGFTVISLGATYMTKRVPLRQAKALIENRSNAQFVLIGGDDVKEDGLALANDYKHVINLCSALSLDESTAIIDASSLVITGDTGMMHLAAACKKPIISIWGSTHPILGMYPYYGNKSDDLNISLVHNALNCNPCSKIGVDRCPKKHMKCLLDQTEERLMEAFDRQTKNIKKTLS